MGITLVFTVALICLTWEATLSELLSADTSLAYTWDRGYPQACECIETGVTNVDCDVFKCSCTCDLTAGSCDYNCCCDPDCSQSQVDHFKNDLDSCDYSGSAPDSENLCYSTDELQKVNPRDPVGGSSTSASAVDELLCVTKVNKEYKGDFYDTPVWRESSVFQTSEGQKPFDYSDEILAVNPDASYDQNDTISVYRNSSGSLISDGFLAFPIADFSGFCNDNNYVQFQVPITDQTCRRNLNGEEGAEAFSSRCNLDLSSLTHTSALLAATPSGDLLSLATVPVVLSSVSYDSGSGALEDITDSWLAGDCSTSYGNNQSLDSACNFASKELSSDFLCANAVKSVSYAVLHDQSASSKISNVSVQLVVADIGFAAISQESSHFTQTYSVTFSNTPDDAVVSADNGNQVARYRSGNPGYKMGLPLLFGPVMNNVVNMSDQGIQVPTYVSSAPSSEQETSDCLYGQNHVTTALQFGHDIFSGCSASFNRSSLRSFCLANSLPSFLTTAEGFVGYFGNADPLDVSQWFELTPPPAGATWQWNDATSVCSSMITGINYKFLVGYTGEKSNPQSKIISATVDHTVQDFKIRVPAADEESKHTLIFSVSASFVFKDDQSLQGYTPPPPPGLLTVPYDIFYPFIGNSAPTLQGKLGWHVFFGFFSYCVLYFIYM